jgi:Ca-activated chloride channel homolog
MKSNLVFILILMPMFVLKAQNETKEIRRGNKEYNNGAFSEAELHYRKALEKKPDSDNANYNLGNALYKQNQFEPAVTKYETLAAKEADKSKLATYYYNLGNAYFKSQKLDKCIEAYKQSLRINPSDADAKHNLFLAKQMQQKQQQQQNQDQNNKDQKNKDDQQKKQNQQNQDQQKQQEKQEQQKSSQEQQISKQDAERLLEAMEQDEKNVMKKVQEQKVQLRKIPVEKEW